MDVQPTSTPASTLLVDESFARQDDHFVEQLRTVRADKYLASLADRWKKDPRPWAREQIFEYLHRPMDCPGHHPLVKRLFKQAEAKGDHELMAAFLVAFDRLVRRRRRKRYQYDPASRQAFQVEVLASVADQILAGHTAMYSAPHAPPVPKGGRLFSYKTRAYLRRRAWRYFRRMGFQRPAEYPARISAALKRYRDEDLASGENILDNRSLMNIAFRRSPVLTFSPRHVGLAEGRSLGELTAAPRFEALWQKPDSAAILLDLVLTSAARLVRVWAIQLIKRHHAEAMRTIAPDRLLALLDHADDEVQQFGAGLLEAVGAADTWPVETWLRLLETRNANALAMICQAMEQRVKPERLNLQQCMAMACNRATPVARLGLSWLGKRTIAPNERRVLAQLAKAECESLGSEIAAFALAILGAAEAYDVEGVVAFFDSLNPEVRRGAWGWLTPQSAGYADPGLWSRLLESPFDDVRIRLIDALNVRVKAPRTALAPAVQTQNLTAVWTSVLLAVHRGGRAKLKALRQISDAIAARPERADELMPVLAVAIRSVRPPEARAGLSAILSAVDARPDLESVLSRHIPELRLVPVGVPA